MTTTTSPSARQDAAPRGVDRVRSLLEAHAARRPVHSVAVLGNAPLEPSAERAAAIDACDLVVRVNSFVLDEDGLACQGSRVDAVVFNRALLATPFSFARYSELACLVTEPARMYHRRRRLRRDLTKRAEWWPADLGTLAVPNDAFTMPLLEAMGEDWQREFCVPTTGVLALWIARTCFPDAELLISGYSMIDDPGQTQWRHQCGDVSPVGGGHHIAVEGQLLRRLIAAGEARFLR